MIQSTSLMELFHFLHLEQKVEALIFWNFLIAVHVTSVDNKGKVR